MEVLSQENVDKAVVHPLSFISTNGAGYAASHNETGELVHPRCFGTFTKVLVDYVQNKKMLSWEEAIGKMTFLPARKFGIEKRGRIAEKNFADIVVFDPETLSSPATKDSPYQYSKGIDFMLINGKVAINQGRYTGERNGRVIKK